MTKRERKYHDSKWFKKYLFSNLDQPLDMAMAQHFYWFDFMSMTVKEGPREPVTFTIRPVDHWTGSEQERRNEDAQSTEP